MDRAETVGPSMTYTLVFRTASSFRDDNVYFFPSYNNLISYHCRSGTGLRKVRHHVGTFDGHLTALGRAATGATAIHVRHRPGP